MKAKDVMSRHVATLSLGNGVAHAAQIMIDNGVSGLPVVDNEGELVGIVTEGDLIRRVELGHQPAAELSLDESRDDFVRSHSWCVEDVMTKPVVTVGEEMTVEDIARLFETRKIKLAPVVSHGRLVGLVRRSDLLGVIARSKPTAIAGGDDALRLSLVSRLQAALPMINLPTVSVLGGIIRLAGTVRSEQERRVIRVIVDGVPGGTGVEDHLQIAPGNEAGEAIAQFASPSPK